MKPEERLAAAFDAITSGVVPMANSLSEPVHILINGKAFDQLPPEFFVAKAPLTDDLVEKLPDIRQEVKDAIMDVMLGVGAESSRDFTGINSCIRFRAPPTLEQLVAWQARLEQALNKL